MHAAEHQCFRCRGSSAGSAENPGQGTETGADIRQPVDDPPGAHRVSRQNAQPENQRGARSLADGTSSANAGTRQGKG